MQNKALPNPRLTPDNEPFWAACRRHVWLLPTCSRCAFVHWPPGPVCPSCFEPALQWKEGTGRGTVSSWVIVHKAFLGAFAAEVPYNVIEVELDEGPRIVASLVEATAAQLTLGLPVEVLFDDVSPQLTLPRFRPACGNG